WSRLVSMPLKIPKLTVELPFAARLNPAELGDVVPEPLRGPAEARTFLEEDNFAWANLEAVAELTAHFWAWIGRAILGELPRDRRSLNVGDRHEPSEESRLSPLSNGARLSCGAHPRRRRRD